MDWQPADYILSGRYSNTSALRRQLEKLRLSTQAEGAILLVSQGRQFFKSLLLATHRTAEIAEQVQAEIDNYPLSLPTEVPFCLPEHVSFSPSEEIIDYLLTVDPFMRIESFLSRPNRVVILRVQKDGPSDTRGGRPLETSVTVLLLNCDIQPPLPDEAQAELDGLFCAVNAHEYVAVSRDLIAARAIDRILDRIELDEFEHVKERNENEPDANVPGATGEILAMERDLQAFSSRLLHAALKLTGSSIGSIYFAPQDNSNLKLVASFGHEHIMSLSVEQPMDSVVTWVLKRGHPLLINDITDFSRLHPDIRYRWAGEARCRAYAELAVPIKQRNYDSHGSSVLGVINLEKVEGRDSGAYDHNDLTVLKHIALRFCLWRSNWLFSLSARSLARLTHRYSMSEEPDDIAKLHEGHTRRELPYYAHRAYPAVQETVHQVYRLTRSCWVTAWLLTRDSKSLCCFVSYPVEGRLRTYNDIELRNRGSVNAWVARTGRTCYIRNTKAEREWRSKHPGLFGFIPVEGCSVSSELCVPIYAGGRLVGTLDLASIYENAYSESQQLASALAEQVGLALTHSMREMEDLYVSMRTMTLLNTHEIKKSIRRVSDLIAVTDGDVRDQLRSVADQLERVVQEETSVPDPLSLRAMPVDQIIDEICVARRYSAHQVTWLARPRHDYKYSGQVARILRLAFDELLYNATNAAGRWGSTVGLRARSRTLGSRPSLLIEIRNEVRSAVSHEDLLYLFWAPIKRDDRVHMGGFLTGRLLRSIGGDIYVHTNTDREYAVAVEVPVKGEGD